MIFLSFAQFNYSMWDGNPSFDPANRFSADKNKGWEKWPPPKDQKVKSDKIKHTPTFVETSSAKVHSHLHYLWTVAHHQDELLKLLRPQAFLSPTRRQGKRTKNGNTRVSQHATKRESQTNKEKEINKETLDSQDNPPKLESSRIPRYSPPETPSCSSSAARAAVRTSALAESTVITARSSRSDEAEIGHVVTFWGDQG